MIIFILGVVLGLFLGWFFIPSTSWGLLALKWLISKVPFLGKFVEVPVVVVTPVSPVVTTVVVPLTTE